MNASILLSPRAIYTATKILDWLTLIFRIADPIIAGPSLKAGGPAFSLHSSTYIPDVGYVLLYVASFVMLACSIQPNRQLEVEIKRLHN